MVANKDGSRRALVLAGGTVVAISGGWFVTWGALVASAKSPSSYPFWIWPTWLAVAGAIGGLILIALGEIGWATSATKPAGSTVAAIDASVAQGRELIRPFLGRVLFYGHENTTARESVTAWLVGTHRELQGIDKAAAETFGGPEPGFDVDTAGVGEWVALVQERIDRLNRLRDER